MGYIKVFDYLFYLTNKKEGILETLTLPILGNNFTKHEILHAVFTNCKLIR